jgi:glutaredoxin
MAELPSIRVVGRSACGWYQQAERLAQAALAESLVRASTDVSETEERGSPAVYVDGVYLGGYTAFAAYVALQRLQGEPGAHYVAVTASTCGHCRAQKEEKQWTEEQVSTYTSPGARLVCLTVDTITPLVLETLLGRDINVVPTLLCQDNKRTWVPLVLPEVFEALRWTRVSLSTDVYTYGR